jgi:predicted secreted hydrolase
VALKPDDIELVPVQRWTSPGTKISYPVEWTIRLPSGVLNIKPFLADSEFDSRETTANIYWEGAVKVTGSATGQGFLELSGYDRLHATQAARK